MCFGLYSLDAPVHIPTDFSKGEFRLHTAERTLWNFFHELFTYWTHTVGRHPIPPNENKPYRIHKEQYAFVNFLPTNQQIHRPIHPLVILLLAQLLIPGGVNVSIEWAPVHIMHYERRSTRTTPCWCWRFTVGTEQWWLARRRRSDPSTVSECTVGWFEGRKTGSVQWGKGRYAVHYPQSPPCSSVHGMLVWGGMTATRAFICRIHSEYNIIRGISNNINKTGMQEEERNMVQDEQKKFISDFILLMLHSGRYRYDVNLNIYWKYNFQFKWNFKQPLALDFPALFNSV